MAAILLAAALFGTIGAGAAPSAAACTAEALDGCRYGPAPSERFAAAPDRIVELEYVDLAGAVRRFSIAVRQPIGAPEPWPIVVWSHGGARGQNDAAAVGAAWGQVFTGAGYLFIAIAHHQRDGMAERLPLCRALGFDDEGCETFKFLSWDRPHDVERVLDWIEQQAAGGSVGTAAATPESGAPASLAGRIDPRRLAYAGHSAGAGATLMVAGARRDFAGTARALADPRPVAFIGCSPQGVGYDGFTADSFADVARPHLTLSGAGDATEGHPAAARRDAFDRMKPGNAHLGWIADPATRHATFDLETAACVRGGGAAARCAEHLDWLTSAALAFLDAHVRGNADARTYLRSDRLRVLSGGAFELSNR